MYIKKTNNGVKFYHGGGEVPYDQAAAMLNIPLAKAGGEHWIQGAVNPKHKGYCTPMTKKTCTPRRKAFAKTMKKHHGFHKKQMGGDMQQEKWDAIIALANQGIQDPAEIANQLNQNGQFQTSPEEVQGYLEQYSAGAQDDQQQDDGSGYMQYGGPTTGYVPSIPGFHYFQPMVPEEAREGKAAKAKSNGVPKSQYLNGIALSYKMNYGGNPKKQMGGPTPDLLPMQIGMPMPFVQPNMPVTQAVPLKKKGLQDLFTPQQIKEAQMGIKPLNPQILRAYTQSQQPSVTPSFEEGGQSGAGFHMNLYQAKKAKDDKKQMGGERDVMSAFMKEFINKKFADKSLPAEYNGLIDPVKRGNETFVNKVRMNTHLAFVNELMDGKKQMGGEPDYSPWQNYFFGQQNNVPPGFEGPANQQQAPGGNPYTAFSFAPAFDQAQNLPQQQTPMTMQSSGAPMVSQLPMAQHDTSVDGTGTPQFNQPQQQQKKGQKFSVNPEVAVLGTMGFLNWLSSTQENRKKKKQNTSADNVFTPIDYSASSRGDYDMNSGAFRPDQKVPIQFRGYTAKMGGEYHAGGEYMLSEDQIQHILRNGGEIEFVD